MDLAAGLRAFVTVAEQRSFTRGAEVCAVPQPVISRRLAGLERQLGVSLLARTSRSVELTDVGTRMLPYAREVVARLERIESLAREEIAELIFALPAGVDPRTLAAVRRGLDGRPARFLELPVAEREAALRAGEADLTLLPQASDHADLRIPLGVGTPEPVGREFRLGLLRRTARQRDRTGSVLQLDDEDDTPGVRDPLLRAAYAHGLRADQVVVGLSRTEALTRCTSTATAWSARNGRPSGTGSAGSRSPGSLWSVAMWPAAGTGGSSRRRWRRSWPGWAAGWERKSDRGDDGRGDRIHRGAARGGPRHPGGLAADRAERRLLGS